MPTVTVLSNIIRKVLAKCSGSLSYKERKALFRENLNKPPKTYNTQRVNSVFFNFWDRVIYTRHKIDIFKNQFFWYAYNIQVIKYNGKIFHSR